MTPKQKLGTALRDLRLAAGLTQWDVARALDYTTAQFISNWERGVAPAPYSVTPKLASLYGVKPADVVALLFQAEREELEQKHRVALKALRLEKAVVMKELRA